MPLNDGAINQIYPFAPEGKELAGDLEPLDSYAAHRLRISGHQAGLAQRSIENRALRQTSHVSAGIAQFIANRHSDGVKDDADLDAIESGLVSAIAATVPTIVPIPTEADSAKTIVVDNAGRYILDKPASFQRSVGEVFYHQGRSAPFGAVVADGGLVRREMYPDLWAFAQAQNLVIAETVWQTQKTSQESVGMYSSGDGSTTFRLPLLTDYFRGTADPAKVGTWQGDAIRNIKASVGSGNIYPFATSSGAVSLSGQNNITGNPITVANSLYSTFNIDASRTVPTAEENRPKTLFLLPCIHAYNAIIPDAQADMHAMMAALNGKVDKVAWQTLVEDKAWKLPNGQIWQMFTVSTNLAANADTAVTATFPVAFPSKCLHIVTGIQSSAPRTYSTSWHTPTLTNLKLYCGNNSATAMTGANISITAIGI